MRFRAREVLTPHEGFLWAGRVAGVIVGSDRYENGRGYTKWKLLGENVAKAKSDKAAHRALYASPSHRSNMLESRFTKVGIAVAVDAKTGELWVAQMFGG